MSDTRWTERQGREVVRRWRRSGQSMAAFAREEGLDPQRVSYWRERVEPEGRRPKRNGGRGRRAPSAGAGLVPGVVVGMGGGVTVQLPRGIVVEVRSTGDVEPAWIAELARALESVS